MKTFVIAEAGANHNKDWRLAKKLIYAAASAGASAVKFQNYTSNKLYSKHTPDFGAYKDIPELISSIEMPSEWCKELKKICEDCDLEFLSTPFDEEAVELLYNLGVKRLKIAAFESSDQRLVRCVAQTKLPIIFSAGIGSSLQSIKKTITTIREENNEAEITVLHCNSSYPTPVKDINLGQMLLIKNEFESVATIGISDHTEGILIPPVAVALGARVVEKHFTLSRQLKGPDHPFAIEPDELYNMCRNIVDVESSFGTKQGSDLTESESKNEMSFALRSLVAKRKIAIGETLTEQNVTTKRPYISGNISAKDYYTIVDGKHVSLREIEEDEMLDYSSIKEKTNL
jgi:N,N'-diacetyllegionaminate synthase